MLGIGGDGWEGDRVVLELVGRRRRIYITWVGQERFNPILSRTSLVTQRPSPA